MKHIIFLFLLFITGMLSAQSLRPGLSFTYLYDDETQIPEIGQHVFTVNANLAYEISPRINIGLQYLDIRTLGSAYTFSDEKKRFFIAGLLMQYDLAYNWEGEVFPELSINYGNICTCDYQDPFEQAGIVYLGYGFGMDYPLTKRLFLDLGLHWYRPLANIQDFEKIWASGGYVLGFSYRIN